MNMKKNILLTKEEKDILKSAESGEFVSAASKKRVIAQYSKIVKAALISSSLHRLTR